jgi:hypothetical protein
MNKAHQDLEWWEYYFNLVRNSNFLMGRLDSNDNHSTWKCDFEFLINLNNFVKVREGKYK